MQLPAQVSECSALTPLQHLFTMSLGPLPGELFSSCNQSLESFSEKSCLSVVKTAMCWGPKPCKKYRSATYWNQESAVGLSALCLQRLFHSISPPRVNSICLRSAPTPLSCRPLPHSLRIEKSSRMGGTAQLGPSQSQPVRRAPCIHSHWPTKQISRAPS